MANLKCDSCGNRANFITLDNGYFKCSYCGSIISETELRIKIDDSQQLQSLYVLARRAVEYGKNGDALDFYKQIQLKDPYSWEASYYVDYLPFFYVHPIKKENLVYHIKDILTFLRNSECSDSENQRVFSLITKPIFECLELSIPDSDIYLTGLSFCADFILDMWGAKYSNYSLSLYKKIEQKCIIMIEEMKESSAYLDIININAKKIHALDSTYSDSEMMERVYNIETSKREKEEEEQRKKQKERDKENFRELMSDLMVLFFFFIVEILPRLVVVGLLLWGFNTLLGPVLFN